MSKRLLRFVTAGAAAALLLVPATGTAAQAAPDRTPGVTDNVTPNRGFATKRSPTADSSACWTAAPHRPPGAI